MKGMRISEVAARSGIPPTTLRYYEDLGLLAPDRTPNGYRVFGAEVLDQLRFIAAAKRLGLPLGRVASLLSVWQSNSCAAVKARLRPLLADQLAQAQTEIAGLSRVRDRLTAAARHLDELPDRDERCEPECGFLPAAPPPVPDTPVACSLGAARTARVVHWRRILAGAPRYRSDGAVRMDLPTRLLTEVADLAVAEQQCCPFLTFEFSLHAKRFTMTVTTSPGGQVMLDELFDCR